MLSHPLLLKYIQLFSYLLIFAQIFPVVLLYDLENTLKDERRIEKQPMSYDPNWNEEVLFALNGQSKDSLQVSVRLHELDSYSNEHVLGHVTLQVAELQFGDGGYTWHDLNDFNKVCSYQSSFGQPDPTYYWGYICFYWLTVTNTVTNTSISL